MTIRRLAAILAADVVGYSRLIGTDEAGTLDRLRALRRDVIDPLMSEHGGRVFKTTGDGLLAEFPSAVQALRCAIAIQERPRPEDNALQLRIGLHQGDVVIEDDDLLGDGVNIAARIEGLAEPGGIALSARVHEDAAGKIPLEVEDLGTPELKNIAAKIRVFRVTPRTSDALPSRPSLALPDKPSIAVLAFTNMSGDAEQEYFSGGMAEDIITQLSRSRALFVIARNSSFTYKGRAVDVKQIGRELGVRYVLEGSVRRAGERLRISAQLVETETGNHIWADRYDRSLADVFTVQDEISDAVATAIGPAVADAEMQRAMRRPRESLAAWEIYQRGMWHLGKANAAANNEARGLFERAIELDPTFAAAYAGLSVSYGQAGTRYLTLPLDEGTRLGTINAHKAVELDPGNADAQALLAWNLRFHGDMENALAIARQALSINPNCALAYLAIGVVLLFTGRMAEGREALGVFARLSPRDATIVAAHSTIATSYYFDRDYERCIEVARRLLSAHPGFPLVHRWLAAALGQLGRTEEARAALAAISPREFDVYVRNRVPWMRREDHEHMIDGLRKAGWQG